MHTLHYNASKVRIDFNYLNIHIFTPDENQTTQNNPVENVGVSAIDWKFGNAVSYATTDENGSIKFLLPVSYLRNEDIPFGKNNILYNLKFYKDAYDDKMVLRKSPYYRDFNFERIYVPNDINISDENESKCVTKFYAAKELYTDANYLAYVFIPLVQTMKDFNITEYIAEDFNFASDINVYYSHNSALEMCTISKPDASATSVTIDSSNCSMLSTKADKYGSWIMLKYWIRTPLSTYSYFQTNDYKDYDVNETLVKFRA